MKKLMIFLLVAIMLLSLTGCGKKKNNDDELPPPDIVTTWPLDGIMLSCKQNSRRVATIDVMPAMTNWSDAKYFAMLVYQPSPYSWGFQLAINTAGGQTVLNQDAPQDSKDFTQNYSVNGSKMWDLQVYYQAYSQFLRQ